MSKRKIIEIDEEKCNGCGVCIPNCPEGAIQIIDGKARLISDIFCDGLGACIGNCPKDAIRIIEREAISYDEKKTMRENIIKSGENTIIAHLKHLKNHGEEKYFKEAVEVLKEEGIKVDIDGEICNKEDKLPCGCSGSKIMDFSDEYDPNQDEKGTRSSQLRQWPIQLHLIPPNAPFIKNKDILLVADCVGYSLGDFHKDYIKGRSISITCPKLDSNTNIYLDKIISMIDNANIKSLTVMTMEVPCCSGLLGLAKKALDQSKRKIPIKSIVVGVKGDILKEEII